MMLLTLLLGCVPDDVDDTHDTHDTGDTADTVISGPAIEGTWLSQGEDLSPLFAADPFNYVRIDATFGDDGAYTVVGQDAEGATYDFEGTYTVDEATDPATILQQQSVPYEATAEGIWAVDGQSLTFEAVQVSPDYGYAPATPEGGFGSTTGPYLTEGDNVQLYIRND